MLQKIFFVILQYLVLFIKKHYRLHFSKKMRFFSDVFTYLHTNICRILSTCLTFTEVFFKCVFPLTIFLYPLYLKYVLLLLLFISYLYKVKEFKILPIRTWMHKVFIKDALFELNGVTVILINLVILLDIKVFFILLLLFTFQTLKSIYAKAILKGFLLLLYLTLFVSPILYFQNTYLTVFTILAGFFLIFLSLYFYVHQSEERNINIKGAKRRLFLLYVDIQRLSRRLVENKITFIRFLFPPHILLYVFLFWVPDIFPSFFAQFSIQKDMLYSISLVLYVGIYFIYTKSSVLLLDDCFYFSATKIELYVTNPVSSYFRKITVLLVFNVFSIFWGLCYLNLVLKMNGDFAKIGLMFFLHLFMLPLFVSANIFVDKNKAEVTQYPEDLKKYMSFIEAFFLTILFFLVHLLVIIYFDHQTEVLRKLLLIDVNFYLLGTLVAISGVISIIKTLTHMGVVRKSNKKEAFVND
ncbi:hypothetical protein M5W68_15665 [Paenibacillus larvae]|uniref:hypothetical protein n=1 Tax=Paenibacillus larvae TaxID=1464 RepID=UPI00227DB454|nr:hypothetical protein [Paenibacillus larvae]MCY9511579.1 hypothetical protein [Paenibacillus larvae]MCY9526511.1 hypothetical protein [Paenibacillus larvae]